MVFCNYLLLGTFIEDYEGFLYDFAFGIFQYIHDFGVVWSSKICGLEGV